MVRLILLAAVTVACVVAAPAQADTLSVSTPVEQVSSTATSVADTAGAAVTTSVRPAISEARESVAGVGRATPATEATAQTANSATRVAETAADTAGYTAAAAVSTPDAPAAAPSAGELTAGAASSERTARARTDGARDGSGRAATPSPGAEPQRTAVLQGATPKAVDAPRATASAPRGDRPGAPDNGPSTTGGGAASPAPASFYFGGLALLALSSLCLAGPRLCRRLLIPPAPLRPVAFVSLLERPG